MIYLHTVYVMNEHSGRYVDFWSLRKETNPRDLAAILGLFHFTEFCVVDIQEVIP